MNKFIEVVIIVEGRTEQLFVEKLLSPYLASKNIFICATQVTKPGQKGGDVRFSRVQRDIGLHLKQRRDIYVTTLIDYYGTSEWPGMDQIVGNDSPEAIAEKINRSTKAEITSLYAEQAAERRYIPNMAIHEFEAYCFSDANILSEELKVEQSKISSIVDTCGSPERINNSHDTAPSKRLDKLSHNGKFNKTIAGINILKRIGIDCIRAKCPVFDHWIATFEHLVT
jgi:hypothetical protein